MNKKITKKIVKKEIITFDEYNESLSSTDYIELVDLMKDRLKIDKDEIDRIIDNHFNFKFTIERNYKNFISFIDDYCVNSSNKLTQLQKSLF